MQLGRGWYVRDDGWKLNERGELFSMKDSPFVEEPIAASTTDPTAQAARTRLQAVLDELNPAGGKVEPVKAATKKARQRRSRRRSKTSRLSVPSSFARHREHSRTWANRQGREPLVLPNDACLVPVEYAVGPNGPHLSDPALEWSASPSQSPARSSRPRGLMALDDPHTIPTPNMICRIREKVA